MGRLKEIIYEQPLNEHTRVALRIEQLLSKADYFSQQHTLLDSHACVIHIVDLLTLLDRPDLRNRYIKELHRYKTNLSRLQSTPEVNAEKLHITLQKLSEVLTLLQKNNGRFGQVLRQNDFLNGLRLHINAPGGIYFGDTPLYFWWLNQDHHKRLQELRDWLAAFDEIRAVVEIYLRITRQSQSSSVLVAKQGAFQCSLDTQIPYQLIQVSIPSQPNTGLQRPCYPKIGVSRHGVSIQFYEVGLCGNSQGVKEDVVFELNRCAL